MTVILEYFGIDLKNHVARIEDWRIAEKGSYQSEQSFERIAVSVLADLGIVPVAQLNDIYYEDD